MYMHVHTRALHTEPGAPALRALNLLVRAPCSRGKASMPRGLLPASDRAGSATPRPGTSARTSRAVRRDSSLVRPSRELGQRSLQPVGPGRRVALLGSLPRAPL